MLRSSQLPMLTAIAFALAVSTPAIAQVTINYAQPLTNGTYTAPLNVSAQASSPQGISGWDVYFNNTLYYQSKTGLNGNLNVTIPSLAPGTYQMTITAFDTGGQQTSYVAQNLVVTASPLPVYDFANIQMMQPGWNLCNGSCAGGGTDGTSNLTLSVASPSLSGASMAEYSASPAAGSGQSWYNTLYWNHVGCPDNNSCNSISNMQLDLWFDPAPSPSNGIQQLEFDPGLYVNSQSTGWKLFGSVACKYNADTNGPAGWYVWDSGNNKWTYAQRSCNIAPNAWHHLQLYVTYSPSGSGCINSPTPCYTYQTLVFDGTPVFQNLGWQYNAQMQNGPVTPTVNVEQQIDNNGNVDATNTVYYDNDHLLVFW